MGQTILKYTRWLRKKLHMQGARIFWTRGHTNLYAERPKSECNAADGLFTEPLSTEQRLIKNVVYTNWIIFILASFMGLWAAPPPFAMGIICGGLLTTVNFHLLSKTLKKTLDSGRSGNYQAVLAKYYLRFALSGVIIILLMYFKIVHPIGLILGLSVVVAGIITALSFELKYVFGKEAR